MTVPVMKESERSKEQHFLQKFYKSSTDGGYEGGDSRDGWSVTEFRPEMEVPGGEGGEERGTLHEYNAS
ncbi:hypothetical protein T03_7135 [Trichinella britovi]|uniref:Uncharacterized protein n=1 Tax=Trichinella britovi TaxID=45882 RepID=A0A0V1CN46_TRIBR|nr:hypothetical protein T03_7135 [Trichinella britovi]